MMVDGSAPGRVELFGILVLAAELPQRLAGRIRPGEALVRPLGGLLAGAGLAAAAGFFAGPLCGVAQKHAALVGILLAAGTAAGALVAEAMAQDLELGAPAARLGRGAFLDRAFPAVYAAPVFVHFLALTARIS
jgi:predicted CDP-diglyceride synthetase/phosphatidate cytidylyltransferase